MGRNINIEILLVSMKTIILILKISREFIPFSFFCVSFAMMRDSGRLLFIRHTSSKFCYYLVSRVITEALQIEIIFHFLLNAGANYVG